MNDCIPISETIFILSTCYQEFFEISCLYILFPLFFENTLKHTFPFESSRKKFHGNRKIAPILRLLFNNE